MRRVLPDAELMYRKRAEPTEFTPPSADEALRQWLAPEGMLKVIDARAAEMANEVLAFLSGIETLPGRVRAMSAPMPRATTWKWSMEAPDQRRFS